MTEASPALDKPQAPRRAGCLRTLAMVVFILLLSWLAVEVALRVGFELLPPKVQGDIQSVRVWPWSAETIIPHIPFVIDKEFQVRLPPDLRNFPVRWSDAKFTFDTNPIWAGHRAGLRKDLEIQWPLDIIAFGDSFTFCWTTQADCWVQQLHDTYGWHVVDAGIPGTGSTGQQRAMQEMVPPVKPSVVLWTWYNNDVTDDYDLAKIRGEIGELQGPILPNPVREPQGLGQYSALYWLMFNWINPPLSDTPYRHYDTVSINGRLLLVHTNEYPYTSSLHWEANQYGWKRNVEAHQSAVKAIEQDLNTPLVILIIPTKEEAYREYLESHIGAAYLDEMGNTRRQLLQLCQDNQWHCIDLLPYFQQAIHDGQTVYYSFDSHLDPSGNRIVSKVVYDYLIANQLLPVRKEN